MHRSGPVSAHARQPLYQINPRFLLT